jgi:hypothetical protein
MLLAFLIEARSTFQSPLSRAHRLAATGLVVSERKFTLFVPKEMLGRVGDLSLFRGHPIFLPRSKTNLVNPPPEQGHGKAFAVARRYRFLFMT